MKTLVTIISLLCIYGSMYSQSVSYIMQKHYEGTIFPKQSELFGFPPNDARYNPSIEDVDTAEQVLSLNFNKITDISKLFHSKHDVIKKRKLKKYYRLYWGELSDDNDKIIGIVLDSQYKSHKSAKDEIYNILDGGPDFFVVKINITKKQIIDIRLNGCG